MRNKAINILIAIVFITALIISCENSSDNAISVEAGTGGSLARFTIAENHLYTVDMNTLKVFSLADLENPELKDEQYLGFGIETIFPRDNSLFLGTQTGMYIFDITEPASPKELSFYSHVYACDPVVADQDYAYVTLNSSNIGCPRNTDELQIINIQDLQNPQLEKSYNMNSPLGLSINNDTLYVCDEGIKVLDVSDVQGIKQLHHFSGFNANDVIYNDGLLMVIGDEGFYQYKIQGDTIEKISEILIDD